MITANTGIKANTAMMVRNRVDAVDSRSRKSDVFMVLPFGSASCGVDRNASWLNCFMPFVVQKPWIPGLAPLARDDEGGGQPGMTFAGLPREIRVAIYFTGVAG